MRKTVVVLTGAGVSAESGLKTFRESGGLWEGHEVEDVATPEAWAKDPALVLKFYNERRKALRAAQPNAAHIALADLESDFNVHIVTQNVDDLHERAGSTRVIHLHGELKKSRSTADERLVYDIEGDELRLGECCERGSQLRPHIVWFGEAVPRMEDAVRLAARADAFMVVGTSLVVYPASSIIHFVKEEVPKFIVDPKRPQISCLPNLVFIEEPASTGVFKAAKLLKEHFKVDPGDSRSRHGTS